MFALLHIDIASQSHGFMIYQEVICSTEVYNYLVFIIELELQIKSTAGGENYNYNYCIRKTVTIT